MQDFDTRSHWEVNAALYVLIALNALIFFAINSGVLPPYYYDKLLGHSILSDKFSFWQPITYGFVHMNYLDLGISMFVLWSFGRVLSRLLGNQSILTLYFLSSIGAYVVFQLYLLFMGGSGTPNILIGASGAVVGFFTAFALFFPEARVMLLIPPIPMKAKTMLLVWLGIEIVLGFTRIFSWWAPFINIGGVIVAFLLVKNWQKNSKTLD